MVKNSNQDFEQQDNSSTGQAKQKPSVFKKIKFFSLKTLLVFFTIILLSFIFFFTNRKSNGIIVKNYVSLFSNFLFPSINKVNSTDGSINILVLGKSGEGHVAPDLTDTMMFVSVSSESDSIRIISIPRDIWISEIRAKINSAYYWGKEKNGDGFSLAKEVVEEVFGKKVHYMVVFDFSSFTKVIDVLGNVEIDVERSFTDEKYPIAGKENDLCDGDKTYKCRYETITFEKGVQLMDGDTALKFVRSRNSEGEEGTDIAREQRQQKVIYAVKNTVFSSKTLLNPKKIFEIWRVLRETVETNINEFSGAVIARKLLDARNDVKSSVIPEDLLINPPVSSKYDNQYVFIPKDMNWIGIRDWVRGFLD